MSNHKNVAIGTLVDVRRGASPRPIDSWLTNDGIPWVKISDATKNDGRFIYSTEEFIKPEGKKHSVEVFPEDLIISNSATPALPKIIKTYACIHDGWLKIDNYRGITRDYLYYSIKNYRKYILNQGNGSIFKNLKTDILKDFIIPVPVDKNGNYDLNKQEQIISPLKIIEDIIENNNKINNELESLAKDLYNYWFLQFEFPDENGKPYKSSGGKMIWNDELKRDIPEGWEVTNIANICTLNNGINYDKDVTGDKDYKIINIRNITSSSLLLDSNDFDYINLDSTQAEKYVLQSDDILIARSGTPGAIRLLFENDNKTIYCGFIIKCTPKNKLYHLFLTYYLKMFEGTAATKTGGSILQNVSQETLKHIKIFLPPETTVSSFNKISITFLNAIQKNILENQELTSLRDFLLPLLMNGQVGFKEHKLKYVVN